MLRHLAVGGFVAILLSIAPAAATQRAFVRSDGIDSNPCTPQQPCRGFAAAILLTDPDGEVVVLDSAGYGAVTVTKGVSIIAPPGVYAGISAFPGQDGVTVNAGAGDKVVLRGLSINGQGGDRGISLQAAARVRIENCVISAMHLAGISDTAANAELIVLDTVVRDNLGSGVTLFADLGSLVLDHVRSEHNGGNGVSFTPGAGSPGALATIADSIFVHNDGDGIGTDSVSGATITLVVERSVMSSNGQNGFRAGTAVGGSGVVTVSRSAINDNGGHGVSILPGVNATVSENVLHRNSGSGVFAPNELTTKIQFN